MKRLVVMAVVVAAAAAQAQSSTGVPAAMDAEKSERCAVRVAIAFTGKAPSAALLTSADPQSEIDAFLSGDDFKERFARFINATFNDEPGATAVEDTAYYLSRYVIENDLPWTEMFLGQYDVAVVDGSVTVSDDPDGLGYFRSKAWMDRYAGNEENGIKISTAYRMMNNTTGLKLFAAGALSPSADQTATGRQQAACRGCHFDGWYALDRTASVLGKVSRNNNGNISYQASTNGMQEVLGGAATVDDDKGLVTALVNSEAFDFNACRLAFQFTYGRNELSCEGPVFDKCMTAFKADHKIQSALKAVAMDATYCK